MGWLMESIMTVLLGIPMSIIQFFGKDFTSSFTIDVWKKDSLLLQTFPSLSTTTTFFMVLSFTIIIIIYVSRLLVTISGLPNGEDPIRLTGRTIVAIILTGFSYPFLEQIGNVINQAYIVAVDSLGVTKLDPNAMFIFQGDLIENSKVVQGTAALFLSFLLLMALCWNFFMLILEYVERYVLLGVLFYTSPLAMASYSSEATKDVFHNWVRMVFSQFLLMFMNIFFINVFFSMLKSPIKVDQVVDYIVIVFIMISWLKIGQKVDSYMQTLGLSTAQCGASLGAAVAGAWGTMKAIQSAGQMAKKTVGGMSEGMRSVLGVGNKGVAEDIANISRDETGNFTDNGAINAVAIPNAAFTGNDAEALSRKVFGDNIIDGQNGNIDWDNSVYSDDAVVLNDANGNCLGAIGSTDSMMPQTDADGSQFAFKTMNTLGGDEVMMTLTDKGLENDLSSLRNIITDDGGTILGESEAGFVYKDQFGHINQSTLDSVSQIDSEAFNPTQIVKQNVNGLGSVTTARFSGENANLETNSRMIENLNNGNGVPFAEKIRNTVPNTSEDGGLMKKVKNQTNKAPEMIKNNYKVLQKMKEAEGK